MRWIRIRAAPLCRARPEGVAGAPAAALAFGARSPAAIAAFRWYLRGLFRKRFSAVRLARDGVPAPHDGRPVVVFTNHPGWWDPLLFILVSPLLFPGRLGFGPMQAAQLRRYGIFRRMGAFGLEPGATGAAQFLRVAQAGLAETRAILWITAQGEFADARARPVNLQPGVSHLAARVPGAVFIPAAIEYVFWNDSRPEALLRFGAPVEVAGPRREVAMRLERALSLCMDGLAAAAQARDAGGFTTLLEGTAGSGPVYDAWQRVRAWRRGVAFSARHGGAA